MGAVAFFASIGAELGGAAVSAAQNSGTLLSGAAGVEHAAGMLTLAEQSFSSHSRAAAQTGASSAALAGLMHQRASAVAGRVVNPVDQALSDAKQTTDLFLLSLDHDGALFQKQTDALQKALTMIAEGAYSGTQAAILLRNLEGRLDGQILKFSDKVKRSLVEAAAANARIVSEKLRELEAEGAGLEDFIALLSEQHSDLAKQFLTLFQAFKDHKIPVDFLITHAEAIRAFLPDDNALDQILLRVIGALGGHN